MRLEWIEDLLAVMDNGSLVRAAEKRFLTQSAFTRRVRSIEESIGAELFDRSRKPIELLPGVLALAPEMRDIVGRLRKMRGGLRQAARGARGSIGFACQHAITATVSPKLVAILTAEQTASVRVRSGNRDECLMMLLSDEVDFAIMYDAPDEWMPVIPKAFEAFVLGDDTLLPVCAPSLGEVADMSVMPVISYPSDVFLGKIFDNNLAPLLPEGMTTSTKAETSLTLAAYQYALSGIGVAWLPLSLVEPSLKAGQLRRLDDRLPSQPLTIKMIRLSEASNSRSQFAWERLVENLA